MSQPARPVQYTFSPSATHVIHKNRRTYSKWKRAGWLAVAGAIIGIVVALMFTVFYPNGEPPAPPTPPTPPGPGPPPPPPPPPPPGPGPTPPEASPVMPAGEIVGYVIAGVAGLVGLLAVAVMYFRHSRDKAVLEIKSLEKRLNTAAKKAAADAKFIANEEEVIKAIALERTNVDARLKDAERGARQARDLLATERDSLAQTKAREYQLRAEVADNKRVIDYLRHQSDKLRETTETLGAANARIAASRGVIEAQLSSEKITAAQAKRAVTEHAKLLQDQRNAADLARQLEQRRTALDKQQRILDDKTVASDEKFSAAVKIQTDMEKRIQKESAEKERVRGERDLALIKSEQAQANVKRTKKMTAQQLEDMNVQLNKLRDDIRGEVAKGVAVETQGLKAAVAAAKEQLRVAAAAAKDKRAEAKETKASLKEVRGELAAHKAENERLRKAAREAERAEIAARTDVQAAQRREMDTNDALSAARNEQAQQLIEIGRLRAEASDRAAAADLTEEIVVRPARQGVPGTETFHISLLARGRQKKRRRREQENARVEAMEIEDDHENDEELGPIVDRS